MDRNLSGMYFRVQRGSKWDNISFEDLSKEEQKEILDKKSPEFVKGVAIALAEVLKDVGDKFDIITE